MRSSSRFLLSKTPTITFFRPTTGGCNETNISFGWGYATVSLRTKKIKGLHENDFIMAAKIDGLAEAA
jgi:hypothetical protein